MARDYEPILEGILSAAASALNEEHRSPGRVELTPGGLPAWDDCCDGQLYLRVVEIFPTLGTNAPFPQIDSQQRGAAGTACTLHGLAIHIGLGIIRCAAAIDSDGNSPSSEAVTEDAVKMLADMSTLLEALVCTAQQVAGVMSLKIDRWTPQGVEGGCHGGEWSAYILVDPCLCREE